MKNANKISAVYFLVEGFGDARLVKVGRTIDTERRLAELQTWNGRKVRYLGWIPGGSKEERAIQASGMARSDVARKYNVSHSLMNYHLKAKTVRST